jgi:uncharacterized protein (DUF302 family)
MSDASVLEQVSSVGFAPTLERVVHAIESAGLSIFARIDHAAGALAAGLAMPPATVLVYGSPKGGTPIMLATPLAALDLPLRVLIRERSDGSVTIAFHPAAAMLRQLGVPEDLATRLDPAQRILAVAIQT